MFTIRNVVFRCSYEKSVVFLSTHKSNYKDFILYEKGCMKDSCVRYTSSVSLTDKNIELNLSIEKECGGMLLQKDTLYDVVIKHMKFNPKSKKMVYKIMKVMISDDDLDDEDIKEEEDNGQLLDAYEIDQMFNHIKRELCVKIEEKQCRLAGMLESVNMMKSNFENLNLIAEMNNNFDKS